MTPEAVSVAGLSDSARKGIADLIMLLAGRFTGSITIECRDGGISCFTETRVRRGAEIGALAKTRFP